MLFRSLVQYGFEFPLEYKYTLIKSDKKTKIKPYFLIGFSPSFMYKEKYIYKSNGGTTSDHEEVVNKFMSYNSRLILTFGLIYEITKRINLYIEPHYINHRKIGLATGINTHF